MDGLDGLDGATGATGATGPAGSGGGSTVPIRFTRETQAAGSTVTQLDNACSLDFGTNYQLADIRDLGALWGANGISGSNNYNHWFFVTNASASTPSLYTLSNGNLNSGGTAPAPAACVRNDAVLRFTRGSVSTAGATQTSLSTFCTTSVGPNYQVASVLDLVALWRGNLSLNAIPKYIAMYENGASFGLVSTFATQPGPVINDQGAGTMPVACVHLTP